MAFVVFFGTRTVSKLSKQAASYTEKAASVAESAIRGVQIVQAFGLFEQLSEEHVHYLQSALRIGVKKSMAGALMLGSVYFVAYATNALAFWYGDRLRNGSAEAGTVYAVVFLILDASFVVGSFGPFIQTFALAAAAGQSVLEVMDHPTTDVDVYSPKGRPADTMHFERDIVFSGVSFVYPARPAVRILDEVTLRFTPGKVTGLVGPSGSGKSTIISLLMRFYDPVYGAISLGHDPLKTFNLRSLRSRIALVTQHPTLFTGTILDNIKLGIREPLSDEAALSRCIAAANEAHCDFIDRLPQGMHTKIGTGPQSQLSGGQKQRLTLARALAGNPRLLLLDEFTSAMDGTYLNLQPTAPTSEDLRILLQSPNSSLQVENLFHRTLAKNDYRHERSHSIGELETFIRNEWQNHNHNCSPTCDRAQCRQYHCYERWDCRRTGST